MRSETVKVSSEIVMCVGGEPVTVHKVEVSVLRETDEAPVAEVRLCLELDALTYARLDTSDAFHLREAERGPSAVGAIDPAAAVRDEARLKPEHLSVLSPEADAFDVAVALKGATSDSPLRQTESYLVLAVTQEQQKGLRLGFSTSWFSGAS